MARSKSKSVLFYNTGMHLINGKKFQFYLLTALALILVYSCESNLPNLNPTDTFKTGSGYQTKNVVIIVIDGPRFKETWGDPTKKNIPHFANELGSTGINHNRFYNRGATYTTSGHAAITTGNYQWMANDGSEVPYHPSVFQAWLEEYRVNPEQAQIITSKKKLGILSDCVDHEWRGKFNPMVNAEDRDDKETLQMAYSLISEYHPRLALIHFRGPDMYGHANDWDNYLRSITETDQFTYDVWQFLQNDQFYKDVTTLLVTNDHGRHTDGNRDGFVGHGDFCEGCMHINLYAAGPDFNSNMMANQPREIVDVASTVATLMDFELSGSTGSVMWERVK